MAKRIPPGVEYIPGLTERVDYPDGSYEITRDVIRVAHHGYIKHDFALQDFVCPNEYTTYSISVVDLPEPKDGRAFCVSVTEIGDEYNQDVECVYAPTKEAAEALYQQKCAEYAVLKE